MADAWLSYFGIRVTNLDRSVDFYTKVLELVELKRVAYDGGAYVLFKDRRSGQRLELNWYSPGSPFAAPYVAGEGLDHFGIRVRSVTETRERLKKLGIEPATRELPSDEDMWVLSNGHRVMYIKDPDGNFLELYDAPEEAWDGPIPDHY
jgi:catechol 2,3-dioxygenase-like lactoylglutathione lyase family enzyme